MHVERPERIEYQTAVCLTSSQRGLSVTGLTDNVSESGIFVSVPNPFEIGAEVVCELPLPGEHLRLQGKVVWIQQLSDPTSSGNTGMGIQFADLSAADLVILREFINRQDSTQSVMVRFEGYNRPIRAKASVTGNGLQLWTTLPFLRLSSPVDVSFGSGDDRKEGVLHQVKLQVDGAVPRLQIDVEIPEKNEWADGEVIFSAPLEADFKDTATANDSAAKPTGVVSGTIEVQPIHTETLVEPIADPSSEPEWSLGTPPKAPAYHQFWREAERRRHRRWLWIAAVLMAAIAVSSVIQTDLWRQVADQFRPTDQAEDNAAVIAAAAAAITVQKTLAQPATDQAEQPQTQRAAIQVPQPPEQTKAETTSEAQPKQRLQLTSNAGGAFLRIPIQGSIDSAKHYLLADPDGVAINLPKAHPELAPGHYVVNRDGFRAVWIRERLGGLQVRVFFAGDSPAHSVAIEAQSVVVKIDPQQD